MQYVHKMLRIIFFIWIYDSKRKARRFLSSLPQSLERFIYRQKRRSVMIVFGVLFCIYVILITVFFIIILELIRVNRIDSQVLLSYVSLILFFMLAVSRFACVWSFHRRCKCDNDFHRTPHPFLILLSRFGFPIVIQSVVYTISVLIPLMVSLCFVFHLSFGFFLFGIIIAGIFILFNLLISIFWGVMGQFFQYMFISRIKQWITWLCFSSIILFTSTWIGTWFKNGGYVWSSLLKSVSLYTEWIYLCVWLPTNWIVYALRSASNDNWGSAFLYVLYILLFLCVLSFFVFLSKKMAIDQSKVSRPEVANTRVDALLKRILAFIPPSFRFIVEKDVKGLVRNKAAIRDRFMWLSLGIMGGVGLLVGAKFQQVPHEWKVLSLCVVVTVFLCDKVGETLLLVTSLEAEGDKIRLYLRRGFSITQLFLSKFLLHIGATILLLLPIFLASVWGGIVPGSLSGVCFVVFLTTIVTMGMIDVGSTAIYPQFDAASMDELGISFKGTLLAVFSHLTYIFLMMSVMGITRYIYDNGLITYTSMLITITGMSVFICAFYFLCMMKWIKRSGITSWKGVYM